MYFVNSQLTLTRRGSSILKFSKVGSLNDNYEEQSKESLQSFQIPVKEKKVLQNYTFPILANDRRRFNTEDDLVTILYESMLTCIVEKWEQIDFVTRFTQEMSIEESSHTSSLVPDASKKKKASKHLKKKSRIPSGLDINSVTSPPPPTPVSLWWHQPDEIVRIQFINGNIYEGRLSRKCMEGTGKFSWKDGASYMGDFVNNQCDGKGRLEWSNLGYYEGDFKNNMCHGCGIYIDSITQRCYIGQWNIGFKDGKGLLFYSNLSFYDGEWKMNVREGKGKRQYDLTCVYLGQWFKYKRHGQGIMMWPNNDYYSGNWKIGMMSGFGNYVWNSLLKTTFSLALLNTYSGEWIEGERNGMGVLELGCQGAPSYKGFFLNNKKHGEGTIISGDGNAYYSSELFVADEIIAQKNAAVGKNLDISFVSVCNKADRINLNYYINMLRSLKTEYNFYCPSDLNEIINRAGTNNDSNSQTSSINYNDYCEKVEQESLKNALRCYQRHLKQIYLQYATMNEGDAVINFKPLLMRMYLWQLYIDIDIYSKGLTLVDTDLMLNLNPACNVNDPHNLFGKILHWHFLHSLISVACAIYLKRDKVNVAEPSILGNIFRKFVKEDLIPNAGKMKGIAATICKDFLPLTSVYDLYKSIGEPHSIRDFLKNVHKPTHLRDANKREIFDLNDNDIIDGKNILVGCEQIFYKTEASIINKCGNNYRPQHDLKLFNLCNLSVKKILQVFSKIFPGLSINNVIVNIDIQLTFLEFYEALLILTDQSLLENDILSNNDSNNNASQSKTYTSIDVEREIGKKKLNEKPKLLPKLK